MKTILYIITISILYFSTSPSKTYIDPTGTYQLGKKSKTGKDHYAYFGEIKVTSLSEEKIIIQGDVNKGAPSYNSGFFEDTLAYKDNHAMYTTSDDPSCKITLDFTKKGVAVKQEAANLNYSCGFGGGVIIDDFFKKKSSKEPKFDRID